MFAEPEFWVAFAFVILMGVFAYIDRKSVV